MAAHLTDYKVLTFDCYGTLIDWETGIWDSLQPLIMANGRSDVMRTDALAVFARIEQAQQHATPEMRYSEVLANVHAAIAAEYKLTTTADLDAKFGESIAHWPAFSDTADALRYLQTRFRLVILSNVHREGFSASNRKLGVAFDAVYTAEDIGSYKPSPRNFEYLLANLRSSFGLQPQDVLHTAQSLFHDHVPAKAFNLANVWIDRQRLSQSGDWGAVTPIQQRPQTDFVFFSMGEMADAVRDEST